jgi:hypothetical protein
MERQIASLSEVGCVLKTVSFELIIVVNCHSVILGMNFKRTSIWNKQNSD